ncbi:MAG: D-alanyl-D-alanine carboxypeptidase family protein [Acidimicrobiales bacterium]|nr:D-alanyl-D-alanine carboxypeptidase family protein [Acidimicrobiales bacterium]
MCVPLVAVALAAGPVQAARSDDPRAERAAVQDRRAELAGQLDVLSADMAQITEALEAIGRNVDAQRARVEDAQRAAEQAEADAEAARAEEEAKQAEIEALQDQQEQLLVDSYIREGSNESGMDVLSGSDPTEAAERRALVDITGNRNEDVADQLQAAREDLADARARAEDAAQRAEEQHAEVARRLEELRASQEEQRQLQVQVEERMDSVRLADDELALEEFGLSAEIAEQERAAAAAAAEAAAARGISIQGSGNLATVGGITVDASIAGNLQSMLQAAAGDGTTLTGSGWRSNARQIQLRTINGCPDVWTSSPSSCRVPTAIPGTSMHERGLAIDFDNCSYRGSACYIWLANNASRYGFYNLPSEPWHWSVNGN